MAAWLGPPEIQVSGKSNIYVEAVAPFYKQGRRFYSRRTKQMEKECGKKT